MQKMKPATGLRRLLLPLILLAVIFTPVIRVLGSNVSGDNVVVELNETLEKTSFLSGRKVQIDGDINGTAFITGGNVEVNGMIDGDLFIAAQNLIVTGTVNGSIFLTGQSMTLNGEIENSVYAFGQGLKIQSQNNRDVFMIGQNVLIDQSAVIERDAFIGAGTIDHNGVVNGDFQISSDSLSVGGKILGDLNYRSQNQADFSSTSEVLGETTWRKTGAASTRNMEQFFSVARIIRILLSVASALIIWLFVRWVRPTFWAQLADQITEYPLKTAGFGALGMVFIPIVSILLLATIIGIPLSLILLAVFGVALSISKIIVSVYLSRFLQNRLNGSNAQAFWLFLLALILLTGLGALPIVGTAIGLITISLGIGAIGLLHMNRQPQI